MNFGQRFRKLREEKGVTQEELAKKLGYKWLIMFPIHIQDLFVIVDAGIVVRELFGFQRFFLFSLFFFHLTSFVLLFILRIGVFL